VLNIVEAIQDKNLFLPLFKDLSTWRPWITALKAIFALPMAPDELSLYQRCTGRQITPQKAFKEVYLIVGRRGGKSFITAVIAVYLAIFKDYTEYLSPGERATIMVIAVDKKQAQIILRYVKAILSLSLFQPYIENPKNESIELTNRVNIEVHVCSYRSVRGYTVAAAIFEESAFWRVEGANPDREIYTALKPAMITIPDALLVSISTPYSRQGLLYEAYKEYFGKEDEDVLIWKASSLLMNPTLPEKMIIKAREKDLSAARAEWDAEFREDIEAFLPLETIERVIIPGRIELPYVEKFQYFAFLDPSGGGQDSFTLSIAHRENEKIVQDVLRARRGDPYETVKQYSEILKKFKVHKVHGDRYAGSWCAEAFQKEGIRYEASELNKSELYIESLPYINAGLCELLDNKELIKELRLLERRRGSSGKDTVDHPPSANSHDDLANVTAGVIVEGELKRSYAIEFLSSGEKRVTYSSEMGRYMGKEGMENF
jgi:hypothetical protein